MNPLLSLSFDIALLTALGVTIFYCFRLSGQFNRLRANARDFETLIQALNLALASVAAAILSLKEDALGSGDALQDKINQSRALFDELEIMIQAGDSLAERLQALAEKNRPEPAREGGPPPDKNPPRELQPRTRAEKELLEAVRTKRHIAHEIL